MQSKDTSKNVRAGRPLPAKGEAMYAPELKANSDEIKISIVD